MKESKITIGPPLDGEWKFLRPPGHHPFAFDFVQTDLSHKKTHRKSSLRFILSHIEAADYFCWEKPVYAPISGEVIRVGQDWPDHSKTNLWCTIKIWYNATYRFRPKMNNGILDIRPNAGNHIMIKSEKGYIVFLAHLRNGSIQVVEGQRVKQGDRLGVVGNSGNSTAPHLHLNLFDQMDDPFKAQVLPFVFTDYLQLSQNTRWENCSQSVPAVGACIKFKI